MTLNQTFTPSIVCDLMAIESMHRTVRLAVLSPQVTQRLRRDARLRSRHYLTCIKGNRSVSVWIT